jgi:hypothetical protein
LSEVVNRVAISALKLWCRQAPSFNKMDRIP